MKKTTFFAILFMAILGAIYYQLTQTKEEGTPEAPSEEEKPSDNDEQSPDVATGTVEESVSPEQQ